MLGHRQRSCSLAFASAVLAAIALGVAGAAGADPVVGFRQEFSSGVGGFLSQAALSNPGTGGYGGDGDGYLRITRATSGNLGAFSDAADYAGDWTTAGVSQIRLWLNDVGNDEALEIHVSVGNGSNLWQYNPGFLPPNNSWGEFVVDLGSSAAFTHIINSFGETYAQALAAADRILLRHDLAPYSMTPNQIAGDFGLDHLLLTDGLTGVLEPPPSVIPALELAPPWPNPSRGPVSLSILQPTAGTARIAILDAAGRQVRAVTLPEAGPGPRLWMWDGLDEHGMRAPAGIYRVRATGPGGGMSRTLVRIG